MKTLTLLACTLMLVIPLELVAKPPPWAPAHGYRNKHKQNSHDEHHPPVYDIGIGDGHCNRETVGTILGGAVGGAVGSTVGKGDGRTVAIVAGTLIGIFVGKTIGRRLDEADRYCSGQTLEHARNGQPVSWRNPDTAVNYNLTPINSFQQDGRHCREYVTEIYSRGTTRKGRGKACRLADGSWEGLSF